MERPPNKIPLPNSVILDTDVIVNWLTQEVETGTGKELWKAPYKIFELLENHNLKGCTGLTNIFELRFLLRRKKNIADHVIEKTITLLENILDIVIPDEVTLLRANLLQSKNHLDPFDAIIMAIAFSMQPSVFLSRDNSLLIIASALIPALTPDEYTSHLNAK